MANATTNINKARSKVGCLRIDAFELPGLPGNTNRSPLFWVPELTQAHTAKLKLAARFVENGWRRLDKAQDADSPDQRMNLTIIFVTDCKISLISQG
jgi:hypothetical protein